MSKDFGIAAWRFRFHGFDESLVSHPINKYSDRLLSSANTASPHFSLSADWAWGYPQYNGIDRE
jgi:hypothetical protein